MTWAVILLKEKKLDIQNCSYRQEMSQVSTNGSESLSFKLEILQRQFCKKKKKKEFFGIFSFLLAISLGIIKLLSMFPNRATIRITWETFKRFLDLLIDNL